MAWRITKDLLGDDFGVVGVGSVKGDLDRMPYRFRLLDDDGEPYYEGQSSDGSSERAFAPLDWAQGYAGCTEIQYWKADKGEWETL